MGFSKGRIFSSFLQSSFLQRFSLLFILAISVAPDASAASVGGDMVCGTYPGRVLTELALHRQYSNQRRSLGFQPQASALAGPAASVDEGHIAVLTDDGTLVTQPNSFDLDQRSLTFVPEAQGFRVFAGPGAFDPDAAASGVLLNPPPASNPANIGDDGARQVALGFSFPFFGELYGDVFINSDGNLTFLEGDTAINERSLSRFLSGPPRIAPYFADLDPSAAGQLTYLSSNDRFVVTWSAIPDFSTFGLGPRETFQVVLTPDGGIQFSYSGINGRQAIAGISPGDFSGLPNLPDLSETSAAAILEGPAAEIFTDSTRIDLAAIAQRFYQTHEDVYDFLIVFTNFNFDMDGAFAFEVNIANQITGIGEVSVPPVFNFSSQFGSSRLQSVVNMGNLIKYPIDPSTIFLRGIDSTLSILGQETGHRFLTYVAFDDPEGSSNSTALLGRDLQHWSFLFNSEASVMEGNRIRDNKNGTFTTTGAVEQYNEIDQYLMGLRSAQEVAPTFLVKEPGFFISPTRPPELNVSFSGRRADVVIQQIIDANGPRVPNSVIAPKNFNFAFLLIAQQSASPSPELVAQLDTIRQQWEPFFASATSFLGAASTELIRGLQLTPSPLGLFPGNQVQGKLELLAPAASDITVSLANSNPTAASVPSSVVISSGATFSTFPISALSPGRALVSVSAPGFETSTTVVEVLTGPTGANFSLAATAGDGQLGSPGSALSQPLQVTVRDSNQIPFAGVPVEFAVEQGDASLTAASPNTDAQGNASVTVLLGAASGSITVTATVPATPLAASFTVFSVGTALVPQAGIVNGASFAPASTSLSPGSIISIFGTNLSASTVAAEALPLPTSLANTTVEIGGIQAPLFFVSPAQINAQIPFELNGSPVSLTVDNGVSSSAPVSLTLDTVRPGIFSVDSSGSGPGAITHPGSQLPVSASLPATAGEFVQIFATGLGNVMPSVPSGQPAPIFTLSRTTSLVEVTMNGVPADVDFAGLAPGWVGLYQVNARVPEGIAGTVDVILVVDGVASNTVTMETE
ncbi:MAG: Ig-like domain-containing protein [Acidobacteria bacterium]|nr:Ig-like domain-containing protein [Acidobacteriota bacterium]